MMRYPTFKNTEQVIPAIAASKIEFAALLLTMILSNTAPWEPAMMEKMDAMSALKPQVPQTFAADARAARHPRVDRAFFLLI